MRALCYTFLVSVFVVSRAASAETHFAVKKLAVDGDIRTVVSGDLDNDGKADLVAPYRPTGSKLHSFAIFWNRNGSFYEKPDLVLPAGIDVCAFDVARVDEAGAALLWLTPKGVTMMRFANRVASAPVAATSDPTLFYEQDSESMPRFQVVQPVSGPKGRELLVPMLGALGVYKNEGGTFSLASKVDLDLDGHLRHVGPRSRIPGLLTSFSQLVTFPDLRVLDSNADGLNDLVASLEDHVWIYKQKPGMQFNTRPDVAHDFALRTAAERSDNNARLDSDVVDVDGDGLADVVVRKQVNQGITSGNTTTYVFLGTKSGEFGAKSNQALHTEGIGGSEAQVLDLTGDHHPDIIIPSLHIGVWAVIRMLTSKTVKVAFQLHPFNPTTRRFSDKPTAERALTFKVSLSGRRDIQVLDIRGDYNGDGKRDLLFGNEDDELSLFLGDGTEGLVSDNASDEVHVSSRGESQAIDLDGKGRDDIIISYPSTPGHRHEVAVLFNTKTW